MSTSSMIVMLHWWWCYCCRDGCWMMMMMVDVTMTLTVECFCFNSPIIKFNWLTLLIHYYYLIYTFVISMDFWFVIFTSLKSYTHGCAHVNLVTANFQSDPQPPTTIMSENRLVKVANLNKVQRTSLLYSIKFSTTNF